MGSTELTDTEQDKLSAHGAIPMDIGCFAQELPRDRRHPYPYQDKGVNAPLVVDPEPVRTGTRPADAIAPLVLFMYYSGVAIAVDRGTTHGRRRHKHRR